MSPQAFQEPKVRIKRKHLFFSPSFCVSFILFVITFIDIILEFPEGIYIKLSILETLVCIMVMSIIISNI